MLFLVLTKVNAHIKVNQKNQKMGNRSLSLLMLIALFITTLSCKKDEKETVVPIESIIFEQDYNGTLEEVTTDFSIRSISNGKMYIEYKSPDSGNFYSYKYHDDFIRDYRIETSIQPIWSSDLFKYGIMFLYKNSSNHYYIYIYKDTFYIAYVFNYNQHILCDYTYSEFINTDGTTNKIVIDKDDKHLDFYINNEKVFACDISNEIGDQVGFRLKRKGKVAIDYLKVYDTN